MQSMRAMNAYLDRRLPMPRAKTFNAYEIPAALAFYVIAIAVVALVLRGDWAHIEPQPSDLLLVAAAYLASIAIHELGHLLGGLASGFEFQHLRISLLVITRSRLSLNRDWTRAISGEAKMRDNGNCSLLAYSVMVAAGPAANVVSALFVHSRIFVCVALILGLAELMPFARRTNVSDGARLKMLWFDRRRRQRWIALFRLTAESSDAKFPDRMSPELLAAATAVRDRSIDTVTAFAFAYSAAMSRRQYDEAAAALDVCMEFAAHGRPNLRAAIISDAVVYHAAVRKSPELARAWLQDLPADAAPKLRERAEAAIAG
jgi:hypothetical protein